MIKNESDKKLSYGVISFYSAQVSEIKSRLDDDLKERVRVGSVDAFQGMEFDVIFLSVVRSRKDMPKKLPEDYDERFGLRHFGFMTSEKRLCVAMSRQKRVLIVVGDSNMFRNEVAAKYVPAMKNYYELCLENGGVTDV
jgi:superfamily I DNA and/or RNA helicase